MATDTRVAVISVIVERKDKIRELNQLLHEYGSYVIGRMGVPYPAKDVSIICLALDAPQDTINTLTGGLGKLDGVTAKATYSKR
ncbi:MAG: iron-only hydrogenase system regulator [Oscillospiraceae bacterium]|nr:iron-only hydrogenase system regulator [Oscillospiraceae bacterium]